MIVWVENDLHYSELINPPTSGWLIGKWDEFKMRSISLRILSFSTVMG